jgi:hypothetical protein
MEHYFLVKASTDDLFYFHLQFTPPTRKFLVGLIFIDKKDLGELFALYAINVELIQNG